MAAGAVLLVVVPSIEPRARSTQSTQSVQRLTVNKKLLLVKLICYYPVITTCSAVESSICRSENNTAAIQFTHCLIMPSLTLITTRKPFDVGRKANHTLKIYLIPIHFHNVKPSKTIIQKNVKHTFIVVPLTKSVQILKSK